MVHFQGHLGAADGQHLVDDAIADDLAHHRFAHVAEGFLDVAHLEQVLVGIDDPVLHHPLDHRGVQVAGEHVRFVLVGFGGVLALHAGLHGAEAELLLQLALDGNLQNPLDAEGNLEVQSRVGAAHVLAEAQDEPGLFGIDREEAGESQHQDQQTADDQPQLAPVELGQLDLRDLRSLLASVLLVIAHWNPLASGRTTGSATCPVK